MISTRLAAGTVILSAMTALPASHYPVDPKPVLVLDPRRAAPGEYHLEPAHSSVTLKLSHMGLSFYTMRFDSISGHYRYDPGHPASTRVGIAIDPTSIDTGNPAFNALIARSFFETPTYPTITFDSTSIRAVGDHGSVTGLLTLHGVRRPLTLEVTYHGFYGDEKPERMGFSATAELDRSDFGLDVNVPAEGNRVTILIEAEFRKT